jgi:DNA-binding response OmpR family regulator
MSGLKILIVDDDVDFADGLMEIFELEGHRPVMVHSGKQAIASAGSGKFDAALVDIGLPDMNGGVCLGEIRKIQPELPCFLLTGYSADDVAKQGIDVGTVEILTKPVDPEELCRRLAAV